jgi:delta 1-pyrroline-5-carboxylate dehydrogenase
MLESGLLPEGALQLISGGVGDLFEGLTAQDVVSFTGSAATARIADMAGRPDAAGPNRAPGGAPSRRQRRARRPDHCFRTGYQ